MASGRSPRVAWTKAEIELLCKMKAEGLTYDAMCPRLGRSKDSIAEQWRWQNLDEEGRKKRRDENKARVRMWKRRNRIAAGPHKHLGYSTVAGRPSEELIADAARRAAAARTITAAFFGDPAPGWSALDRRP